MGKWRSAACSNFVGNWWIHGVLSLPQRSEDESGAVRIKTSGPVLAGPPDCTALTFPLVEGGNVRVNRLALRLQNFFFHLQLRHRHSYKAFFIVQLKQPWRSRIWNPPVDEFEYVLKLSLGLKIVWCHLGRPPREIKYFSKTGCLKSRRAAAIPRHVIRLLCARSGKTVTNFWKE